MAHDGLYYSYSTATVVFGRVRVPVAVSPDLRSWELQADALPVPGAWADPDGPFWAPSVARLGDRYVLYYTATYRQVAQQCVGVAIADGPLGPFVDGFTEPLRCAHDGTDAVIDPSVFVGGDGSVVLHYKTTGRTSRQIWAQPLSPEGTALVGEPVHLLAADQAWERQGIENPEMFDFGGVLLLAYSGNDWRGASYATGLARCDTPFGPCTKLGRWLGAGGDVSGPGGASLVQAADGGWWIAHHGWVGAGRPLFVRPVVATPFGPVVGEYVAPGGATPAFDPAGVIDRVTVGETDASGATVQVGGWALDRTTQAPIAVHLYVDGRLAAATFADGDRPDVAARHLRGPDHGFTVDLRVEGHGPHQICVFGIAVGPGPNAGLGCADVVVADRPPVGSVDHLALTLDGSTVVLGGWALDPDSAAPVAVHVYVDGRLHTGVAADGARPDVAAALGVGSLHGWRPPSTSARAAARSAPTRSPPRRVAHRRAPGWRVGSSAGDRLDRRGGVQRATACTIVPRPAREHLLATHVEALPERVEECGGRVGHRAPGSLLGDEHLDHRVGPVGDLDDELGAERRQQLDDLVEGHRPADRQVVHQRQSQDDVGPPPLDERAALPSPPPLRRRRIDEIDHQRCDVVASFAPQLAVQHLDDGRVGIDRDHPLGSRGGEPSEAAVVGAQVEDRRSSRTDRVSDERLLLGERGALVVVAVGVVRPGRGRWIPGGAFDAAAEVGDLLGDERQAEPARSKLADDARARAARRSARAGSATWVGTPRAKRWRRSSAHASAAAIPSREPRSQARGSTPRCASISRGYRCSRQNWR